MVFFLNEIMKFKTVGIRQVYVKDDKVKVGLGKFLFALGTVLHRNNVEGPLSA